MKLFKILYLIAVITINMRTVCSNNYNSKDFTFDFYDYIHPDADNFLKSPLNEKSIGKIRYKQDESFGFLIKEKDTNKLVGAIYCKTFFGGVRIKELVVDAKHRNKKLGAYLMKMACDYAKNKNMKLLFLETFSFQAKDFYKKLDFKLDFSRPNFGKNKELKYHHLSNKNCEFTYNIPQKNTNYINQNFDVTFFKDIKVPNDIYAFISDVFSKYTKKHLNGWSGDIAPFSFVVKHNNKTIGSARCKSFYGGLQISEFGINHKYKHIAPILLEKIIDYGKEKNLGLIFINTLRHEAKDLYIQHGFKVNKRTGYLNDVNFYYLTKTL